MEWNLIQKLVTQVLEDWKRIRNIEEAGTTSELMQQKKKRCIPEEETADGL